MTVSTSSTPIRATQEDLTLDDFMTGLLAGLAAEGVKVISIRGRIFYEAVAEALGS